MSENTKKNRQAPLELTREKVIIQTSIIGILTNILLSAFKAVIGILSHSIAVTLDAVNNLSDALSSIITIVGTKLAGKKPDKEHPMGHGRAEYLSAMAVAGLVLYAGITSGIESIKKIINPAEPDYSVISLVIIAVAILAKILLGTYVKAKGKQVKSGSLIASGTDALFDAIISASVLASAIIFLTTGLSLEAWVGLVISGFIIRSGIEVMMDALDEILGKRADAEMTAQIKKLLNEEPEVRGAYDLIMYNYGPDRNMASVHVELPDTMTVEEMDRLTRRLEHKIYNETGVVLAAVGVYSYNTGDDKAAQIRNDIRDRIMKYEWAIQMHGFYLDEEEKIIRFDVVVSFDIRPGEGVRIIQEELEEVYPDYTFVIAPDVYITD
jgi:cation diffusion facilitator family transporter